MVILTLERDVKTAFILALIADVKLFTDLFFDHSFHECNPLACNLKTLMMMRVKNSRLPLKNSLWLIPAVFPFSPDTLNLAFSASAKVLNRKEGN